MSLNRYGLAILKPISRQAQQYLWSFPLSTHNHSVRHLSYTPVVRSVTDTASAATTPTSNLTYQISACFSAKGKALNLNANTYHHVSHDSASESSEHSDSLDDSPQGHSGSNTRKKRRYKSGEDSFFICNIGQSQPGHVAFGVLDGVGGWTSDEVDVADYSHGLSKYAIDFLSTLAVKEQEQGQKLVATTPISIMRAAYDKVQADRKIFAGGSTACFGSISPNGDLRIGNLGDSGFALFAPFRVANLSTPQTSGFNTPYQITKMTPQMELQKLMFGASYIENRPEQADRYNNKVKNGYLFMLATDGLWDNLFPKDLFNIISSVMHDEGAWILSKEEQKSSVGDLSTLREGFADTSKIPLSSKLAQIILIEAKRASHDQKRETPWSREARMNGLHEFSRGGKIDDICVIIGIAMDTKEIQP